MKPMTKFGNHKLWRDLLIEKIMAEGSRVEWEALSDEPFDRALREKVLEEAEEVICANSKEQLIEEIGDLFEVVETLAELHSISLDTIKKNQQKKRELKGGFQGRKYVSTVEHPQGSVFEKYCLDNPKKYPQLPE